MPHSLYQVHCSALVSDVAFIGFPFFFFIRVILPFFFFRVCVWLCMQGILVFFVFFFFLCRLLLHYTMHKLWYAKSNFSALHYNSRWTHSFLLLSAPPVFFFPLSLKNSVFFFSLSTLVCAKTKRFFFFLIPHILLKMGRLLLSFFFFCVCVHDVINRRWVLSFFFFHSVSAFYSHSLAWGICASFLLLLIV